MSPHEHRVIVEQQELDIKLLALQAFFRTDIFASLPKVQQQLMRRQATAMNDYSIILGERIALFEAD